MAADVWLQMYGMQMYRPLSEIVTVSMLSMEIFGAGKLRGYR